MNTPNLKAMLRAAVAVGAAALCAWAPMSQAATAKKGDGSSLCDSFSSFNYNPATNTLTVLDCTSGSTGTGTPPPPPPPPPPDKFSWSGNSLAATVNTPQTITINRPTAIATGDMTLVYSVMPSGVSNYTVNGGTNVWQTVGFAGAATTATLPVTTGTTAGTITLTLDRLISGDKTYIPTDASAVFTVSVTVPAPPPVPVGAPACGSTNYLYTMTASRLTGNPVLKPGENAAVEFTPQPGLMYTLSTRESNIAGADHQATVSTCAGDFQKATPCAYYATAGAGNDIQGAVGAGFGVCYLEAGVKHYFNIRHVNTQNQNACANPLGCGVLFEVKYPQ